MKEQLTDTEQEFENDVKQNYITNYASLIADNIASFYNRFKNKRDMNLDMLMKEANDTFSLDSDEIELLRSLIRVALMNEYKLIIIDENILKIKECE